MVDDGLKIALPALQNKTRPKGLAKLLDSVVLTLATPLQDIGKLRSYCLLQKPAAFLCRRSGFLPGLDGL